MTINDLADLKRNGNYTRIVEWANQIGTEYIEDADSLLFVAEAYEISSYIRKSMNAYHTALKKYGEENAAMPLLNLYKWTRDADSLKNLADYLEEQGICDDAMLLARFEVLRIKNAGLEEQIAALNGYIDEFYNDELYYILLMELFCENGDKSSLKRFLKKFNRIFTNSDYKEDYVIPLEQILATGDSKKSEKSVRQLIYKEVKEKEEASRQVKNTDSVGKKQAGSKTVIKSVGLHDLIHGKLFQNMVKKAKIVNNEPPTMEERFQRVVGIREVRNKVGNVYRALAMQNERENEADYNTNMLPFSNFIVTGKRGYGKTLLAETIAKILLDFGVRGEEEAVTIEAKDFCENYDELKTEISGKLKDRTLIIENIDKAMDTQGKFGEFSWKLRQYMISCKEDISIILTGTKDAATKLLQEEKDIGEMIYPMNDTYDIGEYSIDELVQIMEFQAADMGWILSEEAGKCVRKQLEKERKMSTFAGGKSIRAKIASAQSKAADRFDTIEDIETSDMFTLEAEDFAKEGMDTSVTDLLSKLDKMVGLHSVKEVVKSLVNKLIVELEEEKKGIPKRTNSESLHMIFKGSPGTGKTTVARIIGEIYIALGVLPGNKQGFVECSAKDLISPHIGETMKKTQEVIDSAMGGVLFVDEAYSLTQNQFGTESITTFLKALEDYRDSIMVIFAGYEEDMDKFMDLNSGMRSRINTQVLFEDYTVEEMVTIFRDIVSNNNRFLASDTNDILKELIQCASMELDFGNARGVRNLVDMVERALKERIAQMYQEGKKPTDNDFVMIRKVDLERVLESYQSGAQSLEELLKDLDSMEGMHALKETVHRTVTAVRAYKKKKEMGINARLEIDGMHMIFTGEAGSGKTTMARKIGEIYNALGILPRGNKLNECDAKDLVSQYTGGSAPIVAEKIKHSMGGVLFVDEAYQLTRSGASNGQEACDAFVKALEDHRDKFMLILAGYTKDMNEFLDANTGLKSRIPNIIHFENYSVDQMVSIFKKMATDKGYTLEGDTDKILKSLLNKKSKEKDFGNARGVRNVLNRVIANLDKRIVDESIPLEEYSIIRKADIEKLMLNSTDFIEQKEIDEMLETLNNMIGLASVKEAVNKMVAKVKYNKIEQDFGIESRGEEESLHMVFKGNAGTGKTTVARIIGSIYKKLGVLRRGHLVECSRKDLVAGYVGQTSAKAQSVIDSAMGGVLFVDEAYTLNSDNENDYGKEALEVLMQAMENRRDDLMVIFAGYSEEIDQLIDMNQGLENRFPKQNQIIFEDYTLEELTQIFLCQMVARGVYVEEAMYPLISETIAKARENAKSFGNARGVRNLVEAINSNRKQRVQNLMMSGVKMDRQTILTLVPEDL